MFAYDDIASSEENPFPGKVFNRPTFKGTAGVDVYAGCNIDFAGKSITPQTFAAVLAGNTSVVETQCAKAGKNDCRSGTKVLKWGPNDNVFLKCAAIVAQHSQHLTRGKGASLRPARAAKAPLRVLA